MKKRINDQQYRLYMSLRKNGKTQVTSSVITGISERSGRNLEKQNCLPSQKQRKYWRTRKDPFSSIWDDKIVPILKKSPNISALSIMEHIQENIGDNYSDSLLRTLQRRVRKWKALHGSDKEVMFLQEHIPGKRSLSDFTHLKRVTITIQGAEFEHLLYHFRLAYSKWSDVTVVRGGESYAALSRGLQKALWKLGGSPLEHKTDSLSAAFKNLSREARSDVTNNYKELCSHYKMEAVRNNPGKGHENGSVESAHGHIKRRIENSLALRGSNDFDSMDDYQKFLDKVVSKHNCRQGEAFTHERQLLQELPSNKTIDYVEITPRVTSTSTIRVNNVYYTVPSRLIGQQLNVRIYDYELVCYLEREYILSLPRIIAGTDKCKKYVNYKHIIGSLSKKPGAFRYSVLRDNIFPTKVYSDIWGQLEKACSKKQSCKLMVGILKLAADTDREYLIGNKVFLMLEKGEIPCLGKLQSEFETVKASIPKIDSSQHKLSTYGTFCRVKGSFNEVATHA